MSRELAFVLINPYTIAKSRTGGVISRYISRTDLNFVAARMFRPSLELAEQYADHVRNVDPEHADIGALLADYIMRCYRPDPETGRSRRVMLLLFEGEDAVRRIWDVTGNVRLRADNGQTIRDTYGDFIVDGQGKVMYFEPAVLVAPSRERAGATLKLWAKYSKSDGGLVGSATDVPRGGDVQRTLVLLKPDNFRIRSSRPGSIIDVLSRSGLRIVGVKKFCMTVAQAEEFYGPVQESLARKFREFGAQRASQALTRDFGFPVPAEALDSLCECLAPLFARTQFESIVQFMTGFKPSECSEGDKAKRCREECLALVYEGTDAIDTIRSLLGTTDPSKAAPGSVRREFGSDIMVNAAHASDSAASSERELAIVDIEEDTISPWVNMYYGSTLDKAKRQLRRVPWLAEHVKGTSGVIRKNE